MLFSETELLPEYLLVAYFKDGKTQHFLCLLGLESHRVAFKLIENHGPRLFIVTRSGVVLSFAEFIFF